MVLIKFSVAQRQASRSALATCPVTVWRFVKPFCRSGTFQSTRSRRDVPLNLSALRQDETNSTNYVNNNPFGLAKIGTSSVGGSNDDIVAASHRTSWPLSANELISEAAAKPVYLNPASASFTCSSPSEQCAAKQMFEWTSELVGANVVGIGEAPSVVVVVVDGHSDARVSFNTTTSTVTPLASSSIPSAAAGLDGKNTRASSIVRLCQTTWANGKPSPLFKASIWRHRCLPLSTKSTLPFSRFHHFNLPPTSFDRPHQWRSTWSSVALHRTSICSFTTTANNRDRRNLLLGRQVKEALSNDEPIVALESTLITHGLPEPQNLELALELERIIAASASVNLKQTTRNEPTDKDHHDDNDSWHDQPGYSRASNEDQRHYKRSPLTSSATIVEGKLAPIVVTPATVGIVKGQLVIGLSRQEIAYLASKQLSKPMKASRRDVPIATALGLSAGTTVAGTMAIVSSLVGQPIKVFATGGTGGVHVGGEQTMDISADLYEFARSPMGVVSSGFKWFLDTRLSLELLETLGCTVMSLASSAKCSSSAKEDYRNEHLFPGFFAAASQQKVKSPRAVHSVEEAAKILFHCLEATPLNDRRGALLAVPIPREFQLSEQDLEGFAGLLEGISAIDKRQDVEGKEKTPLILERLNRATGGKTLRANMELLKNNAQVGAQLALSYAKLRNRTGAILGEPHSDMIAALDSANISQTGSTIDGETQEATKAGFVENAGARTTEAGALGDRLGAPVVVGCTMIDMHVSTEIDDAFKHNKTHSGVTFRGWPHLTVGGVGRNLASGLQLLGHQPTFVTALAGDALAKFALSQLGQFGLKPESGLQVNWWRGNGFNDDGKSEINASNENNGETRQTVKRDASTCFALVLIDSISGQCEYVIANLDAIKAITRETIALNAGLISKAPILVMDANLIDETMHCLIELCAEHKVPIFIEPTDLSVLSRLVDCLKGIESSNGESGNGIEIEISHRNRLAGRRGFGQQFSPLLCLSPNAIELEGMVNLFQGYTLETKIANKKNTNSTNEPLSLDEIKQMANLLMQTHLPSLKCLLVTLDQRGVLVAVRSSSNSIEDVNLMEEARIEDHSNNKLPILIKHFAPEQLVTNPVSASGAGDSFASGFISGLINNLRLQDCLNIGFKAAFLALHDKDTVPVSLKQLADLGKGSKI